MIVSTRSLRLLFLIAVTLLPSATAFAQADPAASRQPALHVATPFRGTVLYSDAHLGVFVQTDEGVVEIDGSAADRLMAGDRVKGIGVPADHDGVPRYAASDVLANVRGTMMAARQTPLADLAEHRGDWVEFTGVVRALRRRDNEVQLDIAHLAVPVRVVSNSFRGADALRDTKIRVRGVRE